MSSGENGKEIGSVEVYFAKKLANNDKKTRDRALKRLKTWLFSRSGDSFFDLEMMKLWKGLFYCMWFSDKPLVQEELANSLSNLIHSLKDNLGVCMFVDCFFQTMGREWHGIDRLRLDKFYMCVRRFLRELFRYLKDANWEANAVNSINDVMRKGPCSVVNENYPDGIRMFITEIFFDELLKINEAAPESDVVTKIIDPFLPLCARVKNILVFRGIEESIFKKLLPGNDEVIDGLKVNYVQVAERIFEEAGNEKVSTKRRKCLFKYTRLFREAAKAIEEAAVLEADAKKKASKKKGKKGNSKERKVLSEKVVVENRKVEEGKNENGCSSKKKAKKTNCTPLVDQSLIVEDPSVSNGLSGNTEDPVAMKLDFETSFAMNENEKKKRKRKSLQKLKAKSPEILAKEKATSELSDAVDAGVVKSARRSQRKRKMKEVAPEETESQQDDTKSLQNNLQSSGIAKESDAVQNSLSSTKQIDHEGADRSDTVLKTPKSSKKAKKVQVNEDHTSTSQIVEGDAKSTDKPKTPKSAKKSKKQIVEDNVSISHPPPSQITDAESVEESLKSPKSSKKSKKKHAVESGSVPSPAQAIKDHGSILEKSASKSPSLKDKSPTATSAKKAKRAHSAEETCDIAAETTSQVTKKEKGTPKVKRRESLARRAKKTPSVTETGIKLTDVMERKPSAKKTEAIKMDVQEPDKELPKKRVVFELSKNNVTSISNLVLSPAAVFTPDQKPKKGVLKATPKSTPRSRATDFF